MIAAADSKFRNRPLQHGDLIPGSVRRPRSRMWRAIVFRVPFSSESLNKVKRTKHHRWNVTAKPREIILAQRYIYAELEKWWERDLFLWFVSISWLPTRPNVDGNKKKKTVLQFIISWIIGSWFEIDNKLCDLDFYKLKRISAVDKNKNKILKNY